MKVDPEIIVIGIMAFGANLLVMAAAFCMVWAVVHA